MRGLKEFSESEIDSAIIHSETQKRFSLGLYIHYSYDRALEFPDGEELIKQQIRSRVCLVLSEPSKTKYAKGAMFKTLEGDLVSFDVVRKDVIRAIYKANKAKK